jgi:hypothetical protein
MIDRNKLLPRSGLGVIDECLVIAPLDAPLIRVDLRLLDRVEIHPPTDEGTEPNARAGEDRGSEVLLVCGDLTISLFVADGYDAAEHIVALAAPLTGNHRSDIDHATSDILLVDGDPVRVRGDFIQVGNVAFRVNEVREHADAGANLPLPGGRMLQAAMAMLVVAAAERTRKSESH